MYNHPDLLGQVAKDHQQQLLREAEVERLLHPERMDRPSLSLRLRLSASALLHRMGDSVQPRRAAHAEASGA